jgi:cell division transport system ATP-binding protein
MIAFNQVTHYFGEESTPALEGVSFEIDKGDFVFVTGRSGCGKTTLLRLLLRELQPTQGEVYFAGESLRDLSRRKVAKHRRRVGVVFQDYQLLDDLTVWENIALPLIIAKLAKTEVNERIGELLKLLGLEGMENYFPSQLSGGEAQRVGLARALATAPEAIFADEPTGNLDEENSWAILIILMGVNHYGTRVILATHNLALLTQAPGARHLELEAGKVVRDKGARKKTVEVEEKKVEKPEEEKKEEKEEKSRKKIKMKRKEKIKNE